MVYDLTGCVGTMPQVTLKDLDSVSLLNRIDSKYLLNRETLEMLLPFIAEHYKVLEIDGYRVFTYENNYFDTDDLLFYNDHQRGYLNRIKVRSRKYLETGLCFFEIKKKEKVDRTNKFREKTQQLISDPDERFLEKIQSMCRKPLHGIHLVLRNRFNRITFVNHASTERMTLDFNISFADETQEKFMKDIFVLEIKQSKSNSHSSIDNIIKSLHIRQQGFSKYIYGVLLLHDEVKRNNFLPLLKKINKL